MKITIIILLTIISFNSYSQGCESGQTRPIKNFSLCDDNPYVLVFEDNFEGNSLDLNKWELIDWVQGALYGNNGKVQEYNTLDNVVVSNGTLKIMAKKETVIRRAFNYCPAGCICDDETDDGTTVEEDIDNCILEDGYPNLRTYKYTSSNIWTKKKFTNGIFEAKIKIPKGKGFWPAFWLYSSNPTNEIDIFEFWNEYDLYFFNPNKLSKVHHMNIHHDYNNNKIESTCPTQYKGIDFSQDFHIFKLVWEKYKIEWYVDNNLVRVDYKYTTLPYLGQEQFYVCELETKNTYILNPIFPNNPMAIIFNLAIQSGTINFWPNINIDREPDNTTPFPSQMEIDWIKYYQRKPCEDINITDKSQFIIDNETYNVITGKTVTINCNFAIEPTQQLEIIAQKSINLKPGFQAKAGSNFHAGIDPSICNSSKINIKNDNYGSIDTLFNSNIIIYPNPNKGSFFIDFNDTYFKQYEIHLFDIQGKLIFSKKNIEQKIIPIKIPTTSNKVLILYLLNKVNKTISSHKIIIDNE